MRARRARSCSRRSRSSLQLFSWSGVRSGQVSQTLVESQRRLHRVRKAFCNDNDANSILFFAFAIQQVHSSKRRDDTRAYKSELLWAPPKMWIVRSVTRQLPRRPEPRDVCMHKEECCPNQPSRRAAAPGGRPRILYRQFRSTRRWRW